MSPPGRASHPAHEPLLSEDAPRGASPAGAGDDVPAGRHAHRRRGFGRLLALTVLGAVVPGTGLLAAGRRVWGWVVLVPTLLIAAVVGTVLVTGHGVDVARRYAFQPQVMLGLAVGAAVVALLWCVVIVASHLALRRGPLGRGQQVLSGLVVTALLALVVVPSATATRYALSNRSLLLHVFSTGDDRAGRAGPDTRAADPWAGTPRVNVMLVGADSSQGHEGTRPDTVMVASIDTSTGDTVLFNLPRQLSGIPFPAGSPAASVWPGACEANGEGGCFLNATYLFGVQHPDLFPGASDPGLEATRQATSSALGLSIDYEAMVNLDGFEHLVDAMGGITLTVPERLPIGGGDNLVQGGRYKITDWVPAGVDEHLNGYYAEWYVRSRADATGHPISNDERMARQRCFINAAVQQYSVLHLARAFPSLAASAEQDLKTDITARELNAFIDLGLKVKSASLRTLSITSANVDTAHPDWAALHAMVQQALTPPAPAATPSTPASTPSAPSTVTPAPAASPDQAVDADSVCPG